MKRRNWLKSFFGLLALPLTSSAQRTRVAPGLRVKASAALKRQGVALDNAVARVTYAALSRPDRSMRAEVGVWVNLAAYNAWEDGETAGNEPILTESLSLSGAAYDQALAANPATFGTVVGLAEQIILADNRLKSIFESAR